MGSSPTLSFLNSCAMEWDPSHFVDGTPSLPSQSPGEEGAVRELGSEGFKGVKGCKSEKNIGGFGLCLFQEFGTSGPRPALRVLKTH